MTSKHRVLSYWFNFSKKYTDEGAYDYKDQTLTVYSQMNL